jgi:hypothetical protein
MRCTSCGAVSTTGQFCVVCGGELSTALEPAKAAVGTRERPRPQQGSWLALQEIRLLACPRCGAPNSAARWQCARCGETFDEKAQRNGSAPELLPEDSTAVAPESARWLVLITVVACVAVVAVAAMMLVARGIGPFEQREQSTPTVAETTRATVRRVEASSPGSPGNPVRNLVDGDPATSWQVPGRGVNEWVELQLERPVQIDHLLVWNGDQRDDSSFDASNRVGEILIQFPDAEKGYTALLPDRNANVRVDVPNAPVADRIKLSIRSLYRGQAERTALGEIEALVAGVAVAD